MTLDSFSEHLFRSAWGSDGDEDEQAENKPSGGCWLQKRRRADVWAIHLSWIFFFFSFFLISRIFYCFCSFVCDYSAFHHLHIGENSKGEGVLLCKSWLWGGRDLPPSTQSAKARDSPSGPTPPPANHTRSPTSGSASRGLLLGLRITDSDAKTEEVRDCS